MPESEPNSRQTLALLFGASSFRRAPKLAQGRAFYNSAQDFHEYLTSPDGLALPRENVNWLFDDSRSPSDQLEDIRDFLESRASALKNEGVEPQDLIVYYVGHGLFYGTDHSYCLAIRGTDEQSEGLTSIRASDLAWRIKTSATFLRKFLILDCCFSAAAYKEFQSGPLTVGRVKLLDEFPQRGTTLLCSASAQDPSLAPEGLSRTMFSDSLLRSLLQGHPSLGPRFSLSELGDLIKVSIREAYPDNWVRPEVHSPDQREGDLAGVRLFPNAAWVARQVEEARRRAEAEPQKAREEAEARERAEAERKAREKAEQARREAKAQKARQEAEARERAEAERKAREEAEQTRPKAEAQKAPWRNVQNPVPGVTPLTKRPDLTRTLLSNQDQARMAESKARYEAERERKGRARMSSPPFYRLGAWWISVVVTTGIALGAADLTDRLIVWAVGLFGTHMPNVNSLSTVLAVMGLVWAGSYCIVATAYYADDPDRGRKVFYLRGLLGGWTLLREDFEVGAGLAGAFPLTMVAGWSLSRGLAQAAFFLLHANYSGIAYLSLAAYTILAVVWYMVVALDQL